MKCLKKNFTAVAVTIFTTVTATAQSSNPISFYAIGGVKTTRFEEALKRVSVYSPTPNYQAGDVYPEVKNTVSFFAGMYTSKPLNKRFGISNTVALEMQQLRITSGWQKQGTTGNITAYTRTNNADVLPRLKLDFGLHYNLLTNEKNKLTLGARAGQMIALSNKANSYSIIGADLRFEHKGNALFISGTLSPYNTRIKGLENYIGNINAEQITADYEYRIYELNIGYAIKL